MSCKIKDRDKNPVAPGDLVMLLRTYPISLTGAKVVVKQVTSDKTLEFFPCTEEGYKRAQAVYGETPADPFLKEPMKQRTISSKELLQANTEGLTSQEINYKSLIQTLVLDNL